MQRFCAYYETPLIQYRLFLRYLFRLWRMISSMVILLRPPIKDITSRQNIGWTSVETDSSGMPAKIMFIPSSNIAALSFLY